MKRKLYILSDCKPGSVVIAMVIDGNEVASKIDSVIFYAQIRGRIK